MGEFHKLIFEYNTQGVPKLGVFIRYFHQILFLKPPTFDE